MTLDDFYAGSLGCLSQDLRAGRLAIMESDLRSIWFAKGFPLALYALATPEGGVIAVKPEYRVIVERLVRGSRVLDDVTCDAIEQAVSRHVELGFWFRGVRLSCDAASFADRACGEAREILPDEDDHALLLHSTWGGKVFGQIADGRVVSWAAVKPLSDFVWDLSIETVPEHRGRGYARSAVSAALRHVFASGRLAGWGCDRISVASLRTALSVGFRQYALDLGCVEVEQCGRKV